MQSKWRLPPKNLVEKTMKMKNKYLWIISLLCILYSPMISITPEYIECESFYLDEFLDLFRISNNLETSSVILKPHPSVFPFSDFHPKAHIFQHRHSGNYSRPSPSELVLSVPLRC
jgi:hypothetical protein